MVEQHQKDQIAECQAARMFAARSTAEEDGTANQMRVTEIGASETG